MAAGRRVDALAPGETVLATVRYGGSGSEVRGGLVVDVPLPQLGDARVDEVWTTAANVRTGTDGPLRFAATDELLFGALSVDERDLERDVAELYDALLEHVDASAHPHLLRIWNVVPRVTQRAGLTDEKLDRYMSFCRARSLAFERHHGSDFARRLCAASAVGSVEGPLVTWFLSGREPGQRISNPRQEESWRYPERYGPRPPSFARALRAPAPFDDTVFVSGTASIVGHASRHQGDVAAQVEETLRNLDVVTEQTGLRRSPTDALWKIYLRDADDEPRVRALLTAQLGPTPLLFLRADVCRPELAIEIEGLLVDT